MGGGGGLVQLLRITILQVAGDKVKLGFEVDASIPIHRQEIWERMCTNGELNSQGEIPDESDDLTL